MKPTDHNKKTGLIEESNIIALRKDQFSIQAYINHPMHNYRMRKRRQYLNNIRSYR